MDVHSLDCRGMVRSSCIFVVYTRMGSRTALGPCRIRSIVPADASFLTPSFWLLAFAFISIQSWPFINFLELAFLCHCLSTSFIGPSPTCFIRPASRPPLVVSWKLQTRVTFNGRISQNNWLRQASRGPYFQHFPAGEGTILESQVHFQVILCSFMEPR